MSHNTVELPPEIEAFVAERVRIWEKYDAAHAEVAVLNSLGKGFDTSGKSTELGALTADGRPPDEISAAIVELRKNKDELEKLNRQRAANQAEIMNIRSHANNMYMVIAVVVIIVIVLGAVILMQGM